MHMGFGELVTICTDNGQAEVFSKGNCMNSKLAGVTNRKWAWVREMQDAGKVKVVQVPAQAQLADMFTKCLVACKFKEAVRKIQHLGGTMKSG